MSHLLTFIFHPAFLCLGPEELQLVIAMRKQSEMAGGSCSFSSWAEWTGARTLCPDLSLTRAYLSLPFLVSLKIQRRETELSFLLCELSVHLFTQQPSIWLRTGGTWQTAPCSVGEPLLIATQDRRGPGRWNEPGKSCCLSREPRRL